MSHSRAILTIEKKLGLRWERGISRKTGESGRVQIIKALNDDIKRVKEACLQITPSDLRDSDDFDEHCSRLFVKHAHRIWPPLFVDRGAWLVDANEEDWDGLYPRNLTVGEDSAKLYSLFVDLLCEKCVRCHENQKQKQRLAAKKQPRLATPELIIPARTAEPKRSSRIGGAHVSRMAAFQDASNTSHQSEKEILPDSYMNVGMNAPVARMVASSLDLDYQEDQFRYVTRQRRQTREQPSEPDDADHISDLSALSDFSDLSDEDWHETRTMADPPSTPLARPSFSMQEPYQVVEQPNSSTAGNEIRYKRPRLHSTEIASPAKRTKNCKMAQVEVRHRWNHSAERKKILASFRLTPWKLAAVLQATSGIRHDLEASIIMTDSQGAADQSANATWEHMRYSSNHSPEVAKTRGGLRSSSEPTNSSSTRKSLSYSPSIKRSSIGSTIVVSAGSVSDSAENTISQTAQPSWSILSDGLPALPNCQERGIITTSQSTSTLVFPQTSSSEFLRGSEPQVDEAEHDLLGSKGGFVGLRLPARRPGACTRSSVLVGQHRAGPQDTLHSSTSLFNEQSTTSKRSDGSPINDRIEHSTLFTDSIESGKIMGSSEDMVMDQDQNHQSEATAPMIPDKSGISSHATMQRSMSRDANDNGNVRSRESSKALDLPLAGDEIGHSNATDDAFGVHILPFLKYGQRRSAVVGRRLSVGSCEPGLFNLIN